MAILYYESELYHHGVKGMKWGVRRYQNSDGSLTLLGKRRLRSIDKRNQKALNFDAKAAKATKKAERIHAKQDLGSSNRAARKSSNYKLKSVSLQKKANKEQNEYKKALLEKRSTKYEYKSVKQHMKADRLSKTAGYSGKAMKYVIKADKMALKAAAARRKLEKDKAFMAKMNVKISDVSTDKVNAGRELCERITIEN